MKKALLLLLLCAVCAVLTACASSTAAPTVTQAPTAAPLTVDLDLANLSGTVVYSQVYNMMYEPDDYLGKVIRIAGYYSAYEDQERGVVYHACVIPDATACCAKGIEFTLAGDHRWPDDYPEPGTDIIVTGRLETYMEDGMRYLNLADSEMVLLQPPAAP